MQQTGPCETAVVNSFRNCTNPAPQNRGNSCPGANERQDPCIELQCNYVFALRAASPDEKVVTAYKIDQDSLVECSNSFGDLPSGPIYASLFIFQSTPVLCYGERIGQCLFYRKSQSDWQNFLQSFNYRNVMTLARVNAKKVLLMGGNRGRGMGY